MSYHIEDENDYTPQIIDEMLSVYYCTNCMALIELECCCDLDDDE